MSPRYPSRAIRNAALALFAFLTWFTPTAHAQGGNIGSYSSPVMNGNGLALSGVNIAVCQQNQVNASVSGNLGIFTIVGSPNPQTLGYVAGMTLWISGFTGPDTYLNAGSLSNGVIIGGYTILSVTNTSVIVALNHSNAASSTVGLMFQQGNQVTGCGGLASVFADPGLTIPQAQPTQSDALGNWNVFGQPAVYFVQFYSATTTTTVKQIAITGGALDIRPLNNNFTGNNNFFGQLLINSLPAIAGVGTFTIGDCIGVAGTSPFLTVNDAGICGGGGGSGTVVASPQYQLGIFPTTGSVATIQGGSLHTDATFKNLFIPGNACISGPSPWVDVTCDGFFARAASISTTATGSGSSITVGVNTFQNNDWISIAGIGNAPPSLSTVAGLSVTPVGAAGMTTYDGPTVAGLTGASSYTYTVFPFDIFGGAGIPATPVAIVNGASAIGSLPPVSVSTYSLLNNTLTVVTSSPNNFVQNMVVHLTGSSDPYHFGVWGPITSIVNSTTFTIGGQYNFCNPACTGTGGHAAAWGGNVVAWTPDSQTNTAQSTWEYGICAQRPGDGAMHLVGITYPQTTYGSGQGFAIGKWNDFGSNFNNPTPWFLSDANCTAGSLQKEIFSTQVTSGGGSSTLGVNPPLPNAATGQVAKLDASPAFALAFTSSTGPFGSIFVPPSGTNTFPIETPLFIPFRGNMAQSGALRAEAPIIMVQQSAWYGFNSSFGTIQFANTAGPVVTCIANPCVYVGNVGGSNQSVGGNQISNLALEGNNNGTVLMLDSGGAEVQHVMIQGGNSGDFGGHCLLIRPGAINYTFDHNSCISGPSLVADSSWSAGIYGDGLCGTGCSGAGRIGTTIIRDTKISHRGIYLLTNGGSAMPLDLDFLYGQGEMTPMVVRQNVSGAATGFFKMDFLYPDTAANALFADICGVGCASGDNGIATLSAQIPNAGAISADGTGFPSIITGGGNSRPLIALAVMAAGSNELGSATHTSAPSRGLYFLNQRIYGYGGFTTNDPSLGVIDFTPNVPTPSLCLENSGLCLNVNPGTLSAQRWQAHPDNSGIICITGQVECSYYLDSGAANAYAITVTPPTGAPALALQDGQKFRIKAAHANTTTSTLVINAIASHHIQKFQSGALVDLSANDISLNCEIEVTWDAGDSVYQLTNPCNGGTGGGSGVVGNCTATNAATYQPTDGTTTACTPEAALARFETATDSGVANAYVLTTAVPLTSYQDGDRVIAIFNNPNTTTSTVAIDGQGTVPLQINAGSNLPSGAVLANIPYILRYSGTFSSWIVLNPSIFGSVVGIPQGGTGQISAAAAFNALAPATGACGMIVATGTNQYSNLTCGAPGTTLTVGAGPTLAFTAPVTISGSGVSGQVTFWNGSSTVNGNGNWTYNPVTGMVVLQGANGNTVVGGSRFTDSSPTGFFENWLNHAGNQTVYSVDVNGNVVAQGSVTSGTLLAQHYANFPAGTPAGSAPSSATFSADVLGNGVLSDQGGAFNKIIVAGNGINSSSQVTGVALSGVTLNNLVRVGALGSLVNSFLSDNGTNAAATEDMDVQTNGDVAECNNDGTTGTTNNLLAEISSTGCIKASTTLTIPAFIINRGGGTTGVAQFAWGGMGNCTMDANNASGTNGWFVIKSSTAGDCHAQAAAPAVGTWVVGVLVATSTTAGTASKVLILSGFYTASGAGTGTITQIIFSAPLTGGTITTTGTVGCPTCLLGSSLSAGVVHAPGASQTLTSSLLASADFGSHVVNAAALASQYSTFSCGGGVGDGFNAIPAQTYVQFSCTNKTGVTETISGFACFTDNAGTSTLQGANNAASNILTGAVTCNNTKSTAGGVGTLSITTLASGDSITFTFVADGTSKHSQFLVWGTY